MNLDSPTAAQSAFVSVVMGAMTGAFGIWMGGENRNEKVDTSPQRISLDEVR